MNEHDISSPPWVEYEALARRVIFDLRAELGLALVEGKQKLHGRSGGIWEIEGKGIDHDGCNIVIIEARRRPRSGASQEEMGALAYRMTELGACRSIFVSPRRLQAGAELVARANAIEHLLLPLGSTPERYVVQLIMAACSRAKHTDRLVLRDRLIGTVYRNGEPIQSD